MVGLGISEPSMIHRVFRRFTYLPQGTYAITCHMIGAQDSWKSLGSPTPLPPPKKRNETTFFKVQGLLVIECNRHVSYRHIRTYKIPGYDFRGRVVFDFLPSSMYVFRHLKGIPGVKQCQMWRSFRGKKEQTGTRYKFIHIL